MDICDEDNNRYKYINIVYEINDISALLELKRYSLIKKIKDDCKSYFNENKLDIDINNILPRWIMLQFNNKTHYIDPILPYNGYDNTQLKKDLYIFSNKTLSETKLNKIIKDLNLTDAFNKSIEELKIFIKTEFYKCNLFEPLFNVTNDDNFYTFTLYFLKKNINKYSEFGIYIPPLGMETSEQNIKTPELLKIGEYKLHKNVFEKMFSKFSSNKLKNDNFIKLVLCIILRYNSLESYNQQLAILPDLNKFLHRKYGIDFELFGSSINHFYSNYCSLFYDLEKYLGSKGNFNLLTIKKGFYVANPPFDEEIMKNMANRLIDALKKSKDELSFFITIPVWDNPEYGKFEAIEIIKKSPYLKHIEVIKKNRAKFFDYIKNKYINPCDIYIIVLQNKKGSVVYPIKKDIDKILMHFFP
jgi:hypothetical protein